MKKILVSLLALFLIACGSVETTKKEIQTNIVAEKTESIFEETADFSVNVAYLSFEDETLNTEIKKMFTNSVDDFYTDKTEAEKDGPISNWQLEGTVEKTLETEDIVSFLYTQYAFTGGAHGNTSFATLLYDKNKSKVVTLADLLEKEKKDIKTLATIVQEKLKKQLNDPDNDWIKDGAGADLENFQNFALKQNGDWEFYFSPYQVAPYVEGPQVVTVQKEELFK